MAINPVMQVGLHGMQLGIKGFNDTAQKIADLNNDERDTPPGADDQLNPRVRPTNELSQTAELMVDLKVHKRQVQASAKIVKTADQVLGFLLDIRA